ncbi:AraC family transcriptional regulator ligand-binding domain-containing protein [Nocardia mikamii]|uniref:AraC family transcriptional regulator ligand-binding domain-containing protein n=1 Tax=Nocardia mikamii TaxID=508464 RepID=UPI0007A3C221|nr:AraC family transcriptional regulator ligand-binding domain-containing protein [Nocardia mikamii]
MMRRPVWKDLRRGTSGGVASLLELGANHGLPPSDCLRGSGLRLDDLRRKATPVMAEQELTVIGNLVRLLGDRPGLGVEAGRLVNLGNLGIFVFALLSSPTLADALSVATRFANLTNTYADLSLMHDDARLRLVCGFDDLDTEVRAFVIERDLTVVAGLVPMVLGDAVTRCR